MSEATPAAAPLHHPISLENNDDLVRSRLTVFFRLILVIPAYIFLGLWGIAAAVAVLIAWFAALFTGQVPDGIHNFIAGFLRYYVRVLAYLYLLADPYPMFTSSGTYPIDLQIDPPAKQNRLTVFFRIILAIPAYILSYVFGLVIAVLAFITWFIALFTGRANEGMRNLGAWMLGYQAQFYGYAGLLTGKYPSLAGGPS